MPVIFFGYFYIFAGGHPELRCERAALRDTGYKQDFAEELTVKPIYFTD